MSTHSAVITEPVLGFYGKVPALGDFVSRRVSSVFIAEWDRWLQTVIEGSQESLGSHWRELYLYSPAWRFALPVGICGDEVWTGLTVPSVDKVGRCFPLTVVLALPSAANPFVLLSRTAGEWYQNLEEAIRALLAEEELNLAGFDQAIAEMDTGRILATLEPDVNNIRADAHSVRITSMKDLVSVTSDLLWHFASMNFATPTIWWTDAGNGIEPDIFVCDGLPQIPVYRSMLHDDRGVRNLDTVEDVSGNRFLSD